MNSHDATKLSDGLRALARESAGVEASANLETALRAEFRRRQSMKKWRRVVIATGIAASIVMLVASAMIRTRREPIVVRVLQPVPAPVAIPAQLPPPVVEPVPPVAKAVRNRANREVVTDFFPVVGTDPGDLVRGGSMMRVRLPRSAMISFGLPVHPDRYSESVAADVLLGEDGLARAIRFVR